MQYAGSLSAPLRTFAPYASAAWRDLTDGLSRRWLWGSLAARDVKLRYRGSILGPLWVTLSCAIMVAAIGVIYAKLFRHEVANYIPFLMVGLIVWLFISTLFTEGCLTFINAQNIIQQVALPFSIHAYRTVYRCFIVFLHNLVIVPFGLLIFGVPVGWGALAAIPALCVLLVNGVWVSLLLGMLSARYRDVTPIVASVIQVIFFVTPIMWSMDTLDQNLRFLQLNPFFAAIDVVRAPLLGTAIAPYSWTILLAMTVCGWIVTAVLFARFRRRIAYWV